MSQIREEIKNIFCEEFELDASALTDEAHLFDDLELDSLDAADMLVLLEEKIGKKINGEDFMQVRQLKDVYETVEKIMEND
ncbi:acyl carrier protein [Halobacteriovorax sp. HLS]|uniref:acyl carrier protein n=1 Tax=Halobacteriovorax sp. HLS TaxID=2234000 RepID=UPI000FDCDD56|nr:acyl carrier protein [Halobacteriovorax sp. HLS]